MPSCGTVSGVDDLVAWLRAQIDEDERYQYWMGKPFPKGRWVKAANRQMTIILEPDAVQPSVIQLEWRHRSDLSYFNAHSLSDGTLRFMCLVTLLLQPTPVQGDGVAPMIASSGAPTSAAWERRACSIRARSMNCPMSRPIAATVLFHPAYLLRSPLQKRLAWRDLLAIKKRMDEH